MSSIEERLDRIERLLNRVFERLREIEETIRLVGLSGDVVRVAYELAQLYSTPVTVALESAKRFASVTSKLGLDPISLEVVKALSLCREMSISDVTRAVKKSRGRASRRVVREKLRTLEGLGIVVNVGSKARPRFTLKKCLEKT